MCVVEHFYECVHQRKHRFLRPRTDILEMCVYNESIPQEATGTIISPGYPNNYGPNLDCSLTLEGTGLLQSMTVYVEAFNTEPGFDFLEITDGLGTYIYSGDGTQDEDAMIVGRNYTCKAWWR